MLSPYFKVKTKTEEFKANVLSTIENLKGKKILIFSADDGFKKLNKEYSISSKLDIVAIVDEKLRAGETSSFCGIKSISKYDVKEKQFDMILLTKEDAQASSAALEAELLINKEIICPLFIDTIKEERQNLNFLYKNKFNKTFPKLVKKMKNKKVVLYGAGIFLEVIGKYFDLSKLDIIGIADKKYSIVNNDKTFLGYKTFNPADIKDLKPDYVLISTKFYVGIFEYFHFDLLRDSKIKVKPLVKKSFFTLLKEIIES